MEVQEMVFFVCLFCFLFPEESETRPEVSIGINTEWLNSCLQSEQWRWRQSKNVVLDFVVLASSCHSEWIDGTFEVQVLLAVLYKPHYLSCKLRCKSWPSERIIILFICQKKYSYFSKWGKFGRHTLQCHKRSKSLLRII